MTLKSWHIMKKETYILLPSVAEVPHTNTVYAKRNRACQKVPATLRKISTAQPILAQFDHFLLRETLVRVVEFSLQISVSACPTYLLTKLALLLEASDRCFNGVLIVYLWFFLT